MEHTVHFYHVGHVPARDIPVEMGKIKKTLHVGNSGGIYVVQVASGTEHIKRPCNQVLQVLLVERDDFFWGGLRHFDTSSKPMSCLSLYGRFHQGDTIPRVHKNMFCGLLSFMKWLENSLTKINNQLKA